MHHPSVSVLLVEDDSAIADLYSFKLRVDGHSVSIATDSTSADLIFERTRPDVVVVDVRLPDGAGAVLAERFCQCGATVILFTNDQYSFENPPSGVARSLLKSRTSPAQLSEAVKNVARTPRSF